MVIFCARLKYKKSSFSTPVNEHILWDTFNCVLCFSYECLSFGLGASHVLVQLFTFVYLLSHILSQVTHFWHWLNVPTQQ